MSTINQPPPKNRYRCITESSTTIPHGQQGISISNDNKLHLKANQKRLIRKQQSSKLSSNSANVLCLQQYKPLKSQIICLGSVKEATSHNDEPFKKKHRYLRYDASKQPNNKQLSKSLSKSKTASTESLRIHKMRSINIDKEKLKGDKDKVKDQNKQRQRIFQVKEQFYKLKECINRIHQQELSSTKRSYNQLAKRNRLIAVRIIANAFKALFKKRWKLYCNSIKNTRMSPN